MQCEKFVPGHLPQKAGEEFALIAEFCRENNFAADVYGSGDLINSFERKVADLLGFEAACFMPSGTMAQQIALKIYAEKSNNQNFAVHPTSHLELHERHAYAHLSNLKSVIFGDKTRQLNAKDFENLETPVSSAIIELPAREIGGQLPVWEELEKIKQTTKEARDFSAFGRRAALGNESVLRKRLRGNLRGFRFGLRFVLQRNRRVDGRDAARNGGIYRTIAHLAAAFRRQSLSASSVCRIGGDAF